MAVVVDRIVVDRPSLRRKIAITVGDVKLTGRLLEDGDGLLFVMVDEPAAGRVARRLVAGRNALVGRFTHGSARDV